MNKGYPVEEYDLVLIFPEAWSHPHLPVEDVKGEPIGDVSEALKNLCVKQTNDTYAEEYKFHHHLDKSISQDGLAKLLTESVICVLEHLDTYTDVSRIFDPERSVLIKTRLSRKTLQQVASDIHYPLQLDPIGSSVELRSSPDFVPPYSGYHKAVETPEYTYMTYGHEANGRIWRRYDTRGYVVNDVESCPDATEFRQVDRMRLMKYTLGGYFNFDKMLEDGILSTCMWLHQPTPLYRLSVDWASFNHFYTLAQPIDDIRAYFGEEISFYFLWLVEYTQGLRLPAAAGCLLLLLQQIFDPDLNFKTRWLNVCRVAFSLLVVAWASWSHLKWLSLEKAYSLKWGMSPDSGSFVQRDLNPNFKADFYVPNPRDPSTDMPAAFEWKQQLRSTAAGFLTLVCVICCVVGINGDVHAYLFGLIGYKKVVEYLGFWMTSILILLFSRMFSTIVVILVDIENNKYMDEYKNSLILKTFILTALDYFSPMIYYAYLKPYIEPCLDSVEGNSCLGELRMQLFAIFVTDTALNSLEIGMPLFNYLFRSAKIDPATTHVELQAKRDPYDGVVVEMEEMTIQFGLVSFFSMILPIVPLAAWLMNYLELRVDAFKLVHTYQRPFPSEAPNGIGIWKDILQFMGLLTIMSNASICVFATMGHEFRLRYKLAACVIIILAALASREFVSWLWPDESSEVSTLKARMMIAEHEVLWGPVKESSFLMWKSSIEGS